jgi:hypothetical protein
MYIDGYHLIGNSHYLKRFFVHTHTKDKKRQIRHNICLCQVGTQVGLIKY